MPQKTAIGVFEMLRKFLIRTTQSAVAWSAATMILRVGTLLFVLPIIVRILPQKELGLWYVFLAIGEMTALLDFGFSPTVTRAIGYVWGGARELQAMGLQTLDTEGESPSAPNYPLLLKLIATMSFYYRILALAVLFLMLTGGSWWIWQKTEILPNQSILRGAWIFFSVATALNTVGNLWPALLGGINGVRLAQQLYVVSLLVNYLTIILGLTFHLGIWALVLGQFFMGLVLRQGGKFCFFSLAKVDSRQVPKKPDLELFKTLWPMSWRGGLVVFANFSILKANTLICSAYLGLAETASYGLTLQVINFITSLSIVGVQVKFPLINQLRAQNKLRDIARLFASRMRLMFFVYVAGALGVLCVGNELLLFVHAKTHFIPMPIFVAFLIFYFLEAHNHQYGTLIVSENTMPILIPFVLTGAGVVSLSLLLTPHFGLWGLILSFGIVSLCFNDWWVVWRGIRGLNIKSWDYWKLFFLLERV